MLFCGVHTLNNTACQTVIAEFNLVSCIFFFLLLYVCAPFKLCLLPPFFFNSRCILSVLLFFSIRTKYKNIFTPTNWFELVTRLLVFCMLYLNYGADLEAMIHLAHLSNSFETTCQALNKANWWQNLIDILLFFFSLRVLRYSSSTFQFGFFFGFSCVSSLCLPFQVNVFLLKTTPIESILFRYTDPETNTKKNNTKPYTLLWA